MKQAHIFITGSVQGVGYRYFVKGWARTYGVRGRVSNLPDGRVEVVMQGKRDDIEKLIKKCRKGPFLAEVKSLDLEQEDAGEVYGDFQIL